MSCFLTRINRRFNAGFEILETNLNLSEVLAFLNYSSILNLDLTDSGSGGRVIGADNSLAGSALMSREWGADEG